MIYCLQCGSINIENEVCERCGLEAIPGQGQSLQCPPIGQDLKPKLESVMRIVGPLLPLMGVFLAAYSLTIKPDLNRSHVPVISHGVVSRSTVRTSSDITGTPHQPYHYGILRSADNGRTWTNVLKDSGGIQALAEVAPGRVLGGTLGALRGPNMQLGLFQSHDDGKNWTRISTCTDGTDLSDVRSIVPISEHTLIAGGGGGVFRSDDYGKTWGRMNRGLVEGSGSNIQSLTVNGHGTIFAATYDGILQWDKAGEWTARGLKGISLNALAISLKGTLLVGSGGNGIYRSTNDGATWEQVSVVPGRVWVTNMAADSKGYLYAGIAEHGIYRSEDDGISWNRMHLAGVKMQVYALATDVHGEVYAAIADCCPVQKVNLLRSQDSGSTWTRIGEVHDQDVAIGSVVVTRNGTLLIGLNGVGE